MSSLSHLLSPITIGNLEIPNRCAMPPMGTGLGNKDATVSDATLAYLKRRAESGVGLIITEIVGIHPSGTLGLGAYDDRFIPGLKKMAEVVHGSGQKVAMQLHHAGRESVFHLQEGTAIGPSAIPSLVYRMPPKEMTLEDINMIVESFGQAAVRAREAGFDAVEVHGAHGYLLGQFLSAISNQRTDDYGGSFENRARFVNEVLVEIRKKAGADFPIILRLSAEEAIKNGYMVEDLQPLLPGFVEAGADAIHASVGTHGTPGALTQATPEYEPGWNAWRARKIKEVVDVPVIAVGRFNDPTLADEIVARGDADMVAFGRQHLADPDFLSKAIHGQVEDIRKCIACNQGCIERISLEPGTSVRCAINPETGQELIYPKEPAEVSRTVWVVGAGPAGMTAAFEAARLGHRVTLFEKEESVGGQIRFAGQAPFKKVYGDWISWLAVQLDKAGVALKIGTTVTDKMLEEEAPEVVILATGGEKVVPEISGLDQAMVCDAWQILGGQVSPGKNVVVVGGGLIGMETGDFMADKGSRITMVEMLERSPVPRIQSHGYHLHKRLRSAECRFMFNTTLESVQEDSVVAVTDGNKETISPVDQVVLAVGMKPRQDLKAVLKDRGIRHQVVGDAFEVRRIIEATEEGAKAAWDIS
ncbi:MAG: FAD-dependent oxidoreductase [Proteobacteria bacterium]|nr:FAD-dependent oxidoreductase [Pseudomonadota bacterium]